MLDRLRLLAGWALGGLVLAALLGGCVAYPAYPGYGYYGGYYAAPYYGDGVVAFRGGWHGWHDHDWHP
jgi:hypothetical protein